VPATDLKDELEAQGQGPRIDVPTRTLSGLSETVRYGL